MRDAGQGLVEGGCVAVVSERNTHSSRQKPPGQSEGLLVLQQPVPETLIVDLVTLSATEDGQRMDAVCFIINSTKCCDHSSDCGFQLESGFAAV